MKVKYNSDNHSLSLTTWKLLTKPLKKKEDKEQEKLQNRHRFLFTELLFGNKPSGKLSPVCISCLNLPHWY